MTFALAIAGRDHFRFMAPKDKRDTQIIGLFVTLALLTVLFVTGLKLVLFAPMPASVLPALELPAQK